MQYAAAAVYILILPTYYGGKYNINKVWIWTESIGAQMIAETVRIAVKSRDIMCGEKLKFSELVV